MKRRLLLIIGFLSLAALAYGWTGSDITCTLKYPKGSGATTYMQIPSSVYGIVANGSQAVDFHFIHLYDTVTGDMVTLPQVEDRNSADVTRLLSYLNRRGKPGISSQYPLMQSSTYVKATSKNWTNYWEYYATNPTKSLIGDRNLTSWLSTNTAPQRFHIDLGTPRIVKKIYYENGHNSGASTDVGIRNFIFQGSNVSTAFDNTTYDSNGDWDDLTTDTTVMARHIATDTVDPRFINVTNSTPYRYYALKFADCWGAEFMGIRRIELQTDFQVKYNRKYIIYLRARDIAGAWATDWGYVYFLPRGEQ